jgi:8-oxo-dGTP pyrophosphatase MutT (NUDIX family)
MMQEPHIEKVAAFITRDVRNFGVTTRQLLVFEHAHPLAGVQVPAGTVDPPESLAAAVLREVAEEAGPTTVTVQSDPVRAPLELAADEWYLDLHSEGRAMLRTYDVASPIVHIAREYGSRILLAGTQRNGDRVEWWTPRHSVTRDVRRWLYHLQLTAPAPDTWHRAFDEPEPWHFSWVPLERASLAGVQSDWLALMRQKLSV